MTISKLVSTNLLLLLTNLFGLLFSAIGTSALALFILKKFGIKSVSGKEIEVKPLIMSF